MKEYGNKDISSIIGIAGPTVRKYSALLEKAGYTFTRNELGHRVFLDKDIPVFREMKTLSEQGTLPLERIATIVAGDHGRYEEDKKEAKNTSENPVAGPATSASETAPMLHSGYSDEMHTLLKHVAEKLATVDDMARELQEVKEENRKLREMMDKRFMETLREVQETRKELATTREEPKGLWQRLFGK